MAVAHVVLSVMLAAIFVPLGVAKILRQPSLMVAGAAGPAAAVLAIA